MTLYTKIKKNRKDTIENFLTKFLFSYLSPYSKSYKADCTFLNKEYTVLQCEQGRSRSIDDLFAVAKGVQHNISFETFAKALLNIAIKNKLYFIFCTTIDKWVFRYTVNGGTHIELEGVNIVGNCDRCYRKVYYSGNALYCFDDLLVAAGIHITYASNQIYKKKK